MVVVEEAVEAEVTSATVSVEEEGDEEEAVGVVLVVLIVKGIPDGVEEVVGHEGVMVLQAEVVDEGVTRVPLHHRGTVLVLHLAADADRLRILARGPLVRHHPDATMVPREVHHADDPGVQCRGHRDRGLLVKVQDAGALAEAGAEAYPGGIPEEARRHRDDAVHLHQEGEVDLPPEHLHARGLLQGHQVQRVEGHLRHRAAETRGRRRHLLVAGLVPVLLHHLLAGVARDHPLRNKGGAHPHEDGLLHQLLPGAWDPVHPHLLEAAMVA